MPEPILFAGEGASNAARRVIAAQEPLALRTFTPSQLVIARSAGVFHWTPEGRRLYDYTSGVLVANLGHNPTRWMRRLAGYMNWTPEALFGSRGLAARADDYFEGVALTAYNAVTEVEAQAVSRLVKCAQSFRGGNRLDTVMWAASGSEAVQKALWACLHRDPRRDVILATRHGFHGKKGLAGAVTGSETDADRDPRVRFISFPMKECDDLANDGSAFDARPYQAELEQLAAQHGGRLCCLITEPYLGGGGSYHPPAAYLQLLERFCRAHDVLFVLDEVQSNYGRTGCMFAFEKYGLEPDFVILGKGLGNGVPVSAALGRGDVMQSLKYGEASDTWSANPLACAAVLATLDEFEAGKVLDHVRRLNGLFQEGLTRLKQTGLIAKVRGEGLVFGLECANCQGRDSRQIAVEIVKSAYLGNSAGEGIHLLGPLAGNVIRISPPLVISEEQARASLALLYELVAGVERRLAGSRAATVSVGAG